MSRATVLVLGLLLGALGLGPAEAQEPSPSPTPVPEGLSSGSSGEADYDQAPRPIHLTRPRYPEDAFERKIEGTVVLEIAIDEQGRVSKARTVVSIPALDKAALDCVKGWTFTPATKDGRPVATTVRAPVTFRIFGGKPPRDSSPITSLVRSETDDGRSLSLSSFASKGANFGSWLARFKTEVYDHWDVSKRLHSGAPRTVRVELVVEKDGTVSKVRRVRPDAQAMAADPALLDLDDSAQEAVRAAHLPALPPDYKPKRLTLEVSFTAQKPSPHAEAASKKQEPPPPPPSADDAWARSHGLVGDYDKAPRAVDVKPPAYPTDAFERSIEGTVFLDLAVDAQGRVIDARVARSVPGLDRAALDCVKRWTFEPARKDGHPVAAPARAPMTFRITGDRSAPELFTPPSAEDADPH